MSGFDRSATLVDRSNADAPSMGRGVFVLLFLCYTMNMLDRSIIAFVAVPLKADLALSDADFGIITGPVFSVAYGLFSLLFAYLADRGNRANLLCVLLGFWSVATIACGFAHSFVQLLLARLVVGIGEAGGTPTSYALVTECVPKDRLSSAYATFVLATPCGILLAATAGSYIAEAYGWRTAFIICGIAGLLLALVIKAKIRDPRKIIRGTPSAETSRRSFRDVLNGVADSFRMVKTRRSVMLILASYSFSSFLWLGVQNWSPIFFNRYHGVSPHDAGVYSGLVYCAGLAPGLVLGGLLTDRLVRKNHMWILHVPWAALLLSIPLFLLAFHSLDWSVSLVALALAAFTLQMGTGATLGAFNAVLPAEVRTFGTAGLLLGSAVVGGGLGNLLVGLLSDCFVGLFGSSSLRVSLLMLLCIFGLIAWLLLTLARRHYTFDIQHVGSRSNEMS